MTLIVSAVNRDQAIQVSDRRLTSSGVVADDSYNKATFFVCGDAVVSIGFSGVARTDRGFDFSEWLLGALSSCAPPDYTVDGTLHRLGGELERMAAREFASLPASHRRLSVFAAGYAALDDPPLGYVGCLSNFEHDLDAPLDLPTPEFTRHRIVERTNPRQAAVRCLLVGGATTGIQETDLAPLRGALDNGMSADVIVTRAIALIRRAANNPASRGLIGKDCMSIIVPANLGDALARYHPDRRDPTGYSPNFVRARGDGGLDMQISDAFTIGFDSGGNPVLPPWPKVGRNKPCPCGSGKKYKKCHGVRASA